MKLRAFAWICAVSLAVLSGCSGDRPLEPSVTHPQTQSLDLSVTPMENEEAEIAAMVLSRELVAPKWLYERIRGDLERIRREFRDSIPSVILPLVKPWVPSQVLMGVDTTVFFDTTSTGYRRFDSLCAVYRLDSSRWSIYGEGSLTFEGRLNSSRLVDLLAGLPGLCYVAVNGYFNWTHVEAYLYPDGRTFRYFFQDGWGDCPAGCITMRIDYFSTDLFNVTYHGKHITNEGPPPPWMDTVNMAIDTMNDYHSWRSEECPR